jgi:hypothetical protein
VSKFHPAVWPHWKHLREVTRNFFGALRRGLLTENEQRVMRKELRQAEKAYDEAAEKHRD